MPERNIVNKLNRFLRSIPIMNYSALCRELALKSRLGSSQNWARTLSASNPLRNCNATLAPLQSVINPVPFIGSDFAPSATSFCDLPFISGQTEADRPVLGLESTIKNFENAAKPTPAPCAVWDSAGSRSSGKCGKPTPAMMASSIAKTNCGAGLGSYHQRPPNLASTMSITSRKTQFANQRTSFFLASSIEGRRVSFSR